MSIIDRVRSTAGNTFAQQAGQTRLPGLLGATVPGALARGIKGGPDALKAVLPTKKGLLDLGLAEVDRTLTGAGRQQSQLRRQQSGLGAFGAPGPSANPTPAAGPTGGQDKPWTGAPIWGGLSVDEFRQLFADTAMIPKAWKNLFHVSITEYAPSNEAPAGPEGLNLLAADVSFGPCTTTGEALQFGSANGDRLQGTERVELRMTTFDDARGSLERWFIAKSDQLAHTDGTFGLPSEYLLIVQIVEMDPSGQARPADRMTQRWLMRPGSIEVELSRRDMALKELQMSFVQWDTFIKVP